MFKQHFVDLVNINSAISLLWLQAGMRGPKLNTMTVLMYHLLFGTGKYEAGTREMKRC